MAATKKSSKTNEPTTKPLRFVHVSTLHGGEFDALRGVDRDQLLAACRDGDGKDYASLGAFAAAWEEEVGGTPVAQLWDVLEGDAARFRLVFFPLSDSGTLFHAGSAKLAHLALWPDGFEPKGGKPAIDPEALTDAFENREEPPRKKRST